MFQIKDEDINDDNDETMLEKENSLTHLEENLKPVPNTSIQQIKMKETIQENSNINTYIESPKKTSDEHQLFLDFVGQELRSFKSEELKKKFKKKILQLLIEISDEDDL